MIFKKKNKKISSPIPIYQQINLEKIEESFNDAFAEVDKFIELSNLKEELDKDLKISDTKKKKPKI